MDESSIDISAARNLFSKVEKLSFVFEGTGDAQVKTIILCFRQSVRKQVQDVFVQLADHVIPEKLKLTILDNGGDFVTLTFFWESKSVLFATSPEHYVLAECRQFRKNAFYGDDVQLSFMVTENEHEKEVTAYRNDKLITHLDLVYYEYLS